MTFYVFCSRAKGTLHCLLFTVAHNLSSVETKTEEGENGQCLIGPLMKEKCPLKLEKICRIPEKAVEIFFIVKLTVAAKPSLYELHPTLPVNKAYWFISGGLQKCIK